MANEAFTQIKNNFEGYMNNSSALQRACIDNLEAAYNGNMEISDPTNPLISLLEYSTVFAVGNLEKLKAECKSLYPKLAVEASEVYKWMSDDDFLDPFSRPGKAPFMLLLSYEEILSKAVYYPAGGYRKLVIPRNTRVTVDNVVYTSQYPIEIRVMNQGNIITVYDTSKPSPILSLETNIVYSFRTRIEDTDLLCLEFPLEQMSIGVRSNIALTSATGFNKTYNYTDRYYCTRAFYFSNNRWLEMKVTLSDQVFDPLEFTLLVKVFETNSATSSNTVNYSIPAVYFMNGLTDNKNIMIWTYTTKGDYSSNLADLAPNSFVVEYLDLDDSVDEFNNDPSIYYSPLNTFKTSSMFSPGRCSGGSNAISVAELRDRVIDNATGMPKLPITDDQVIIEWKDIGFDIVKSVDNITDREYIITRDIPNIQTTLSAESDINLMTNAAISPLAMNIKTNNVNITSLVEHNSVYDNGNRITILPKTLYQENDGIVSVVDDSVRESFASMSSIEKATLINSSRFSYTPFHYITYLTNESFTIKPFWLQNPKILRKQFIEENDKIGLSTSIKSYSLELMDFGYRILATTKSNTAFKNFIKNKSYSIFSQLSFIPSDSSTRVIINGNIVDPVTYYGNNQTIVDEGELLLQFDIYVTETEVIDGVTVIKNGFDIDNNDNYIMKGFTMSDGFHRDFKARLETEFDVIVIVDARSIDDASAIDSSTKTTIDNAVGRWLLNETTDVYRGIVQERLHIKFGSPMEKLWSKSRTIITEDSYKRYTDDVPLVYAEDEYEKENGIMKFTIVDGVITYNKLHSKGDPVLDGEGNPIIQFHAGDIELDDEGNPVLKSNRERNHLVDLCLFEGLYYFANEKFAARYANKVPDDMAIWVNETIQGLENQFLEQTHSIFYPKTSYGTIDVYINDTGLITMRADQSFFFTVYVNKKVYDDGDMRASIQQNVISVINSELRNTIVSELSIMNKIKETLGTVIEGFKMSLFGDNKDINTFTLKDATHYLNIAKRLNIASDGMLIVEDAVDFEFILHDYNTMNK